MVKPFKNVRIRKWITSAVLAGSLVRSSKFTSLESSSQKHNNSVVHEKVIENELNSLEDSHNSGRIIETGTGTLNEILSEHNLWSNDTDEVILVKDDGILPGVDGYVRNNNSIGSSKNERFEVN